MRPEYPYTQYMYSYPHKTAYRTLEGIYLDDYIHYLRETKENDLYFHIPFCKSKCGYCNLFSLSGQKEDLMKTYLEAMERQAREYDMKQISFRSLTIGGGTPLYLPAKLLDRLFCLTKDYFGKTEEYETIVETSPRQTTWEKLLILKNYGVTRVSIGVQSFQREELLTLHRNHSVKEAGIALEQIKKAGFACVNLDLIYGIPGQNQNTLKSSADQALSFEPDELFVYPLYVKKGTRLYKEGLKTAKEAFELYRFIRDYLEDKGYRQTSMRRFVKSFDTIGLGSVPESMEGGCGFSENTISIGCGGRSYIDCLHFCTPFCVLPSHCGKVLKDYIDCKSYREIKYGTLLSEEEKKRRYVIKNLLYTNGLPLREYENLFHSNAKKDFPQLSWVLDENYGYIAAKETPYEALRLTKEGLARSDYLGPMFISQEVKRKMEEWKEPE